MLPKITDLYHQFDARFPHGYYRSPSLITSLRGTLLAFAYGKYHRTDSTPNQIFLRRSEDDGITWTAAREVIYDTTNRTEFYGAPLLDAHTGRMTYLFALYKWHTPAIGCALHSVASDDDGKTWSQPKPIAVNGRANSTWGSALASGITLTRGPNAGRLLLALRSDCGVVAARTSFVIYSDDHGATWTGGERMELLPQFGGGWTECQVAELYNGSVLMTSRNFYGASSGQGPRLFARSDDGGATWAANWSATETELPDPYCEGSILADPCVPHLLLPRTVLISNLVVPHDGCPLSRPLPACAARPFACMCRSARSFDHTICQACCHRLPLAL